jgi:hypothetical protein
MKDRSNNETNNQIHQIKPRVLVKDVLLLKRKEFSKDLDKIDLEILNLKEECSKKIGQLLLKKKPAVEGMNHIDALLKIEGIKTNEITNGSELQNESMLNVRSSITDAVFNFLEEVHKPLHYLELTKKMQEKDVFIPGKNPSATLLSRINRDKRFKRTARRGTYALATWRVRSGKTRRRKGKKKKINGK